MLLPTKLTLILKAYRFSKNQMGLKMSNIWVKEELGKSALKPKR
jgi:hypothetical protein